MYVISIIAAFAVLGRFGDAVISPTVNPTRAPTVLPTTAKPTALPTTRRPTTFTPTFLPTTRTPTYDPTLSPTSSPTVIPSEAPQTVYVSVPIAMHQLVVVNTAGSTLIKLHTYDVYENKVSLTMDSVPTTGTTQQLSQVFSNYGYEPKGGALISSGDVVTGSNGRIYYSRPSPDVASDSQQWGTFNFTATSAAGVSFPGTVTLVPPSGALVGSNFLLNNDNWKITGNKIAYTNATYEPYSRGALLNHYITGTEDKISVDVSGANDESLWYFEAPSKFLGNRGITYGGTLELTLSSFSGDFSALNSDKTNVVELYCATCPGPVTMGVTLAFPISSLRKNVGGMFSGTTKRITIPLVEMASTSTVGWRKDPQNSLLSWTSASQCDVIMVLSRLSRMRILGDWTVWSETVALDDVRFVNTKGRLPLCAMSRPDASICTC